MKILTNTTIDGSVNSLGTEPRYFKNGIPLIQKWRSPNIAIITGGLFTFNHGLILNTSLDLFLIQFYLVNTTAEYGYLPGEIVTVDSGVTATVSNSQINVIVSNSGVVVSRKNGNRKTVSISPNSWQLIINLGVF